MKSLAKPFVLFAASREQLKYFESLKQNLTVDTEVIWYKSLVMPSLFIQYPLTELWKQAKLLAKRKQNSRKGRHYPSLIWPLFTLVSFLQACWLYAIYTGWLKKLSADFIGIWNGKKFRQAVLVIAVQQANKKVIYFETGPLPGLSAIDPLGVNFYSSIPNNVEFYLNRRLSGNLEEKSLQSQTNRPGHLSKHFILVPFQVVEDSNIYLHSQWIRNMRQLFAVCQSLSEQAKGKLTFVFKEHPACDESYDDLRKQQTANLQFIDDLSTTDLVEYADAIITINSTVGIEGLMAGKKVFVLGDALFGIEGICYPVTSQQALLEGLLHIEERVLNEAVVASFIDYLKYDYGIPGNAMKSPGSDHWLAANQRVSLLLEGKSVEAFKL